MGPALAQKDVLIIDRFGINPDFIRRELLTWIHGLSTGNPNTPNLADPRHPQHHHADVQAYLKKYGARKVEASALVVKPEAARDVCRDAILRYVDGSRIPEFERHEAQQQALVQAEIQHMLRRRWSGRR
jgi:hypothetical protein